MRGGIFASKTAVALSPRGIVPLRLHSCLKLAKIESPGSKILTSTRLTPRISICRLPSFNNNVPRNSIYECLFVRRTSVKESFQMYFRAKRRQSSFLKMIWRDFYSGILTIMRKIHFRISDWHPFDGKYIFRDSFSKLVITKRATWIESGGQICWGKIFEKQWI